MTPIFLKRKPLCNAILLCIALYTFVLFPLVPLWAQEFDIIAPSIKYRPSPYPAMSGKPFEIVSIITDSAGVKEVILFYRPTGKEVYLRLPMAEKPNNVYSAIISEDLVLEPKLEFYIQAMDASGNISFQGSSALPLQISVLAQSQHEPPPPVTAESTSPPPILSPDIGRTPTPSPEKPPIVFSASPSDPSKSTTGPVSGVLKTKTTPSGQAFYKKWWFWPAVVAVAGGTAWAINSSGGSKPPPTGNVTLVIPQP